MTLFHFLRAKSKTAQEQEDPLIKTHTEIKKNGRFTITATVSNGKRIREIVDMRYPNSHQVQCRVTRTADELSGHYQNRTFDPGIWISKSTLTVPYGTIEHFDKTGALISRNEKKFTYKRLVYFNKDGSEIVAYDTRQKAQSIKVGTHLLPVRSLAYEHS